MIASKIVARSTSLDLLDRLAVLYLVLPLPIFLFGWIEIWAAIPLALCGAYSLKSLAASLPAERWPVSAPKLAVAAAVGCAWAACGGTGHLVFANADWHLRDAVLHDLVTGRWPVGYGVLEGGDSLLRAPIGYYLPAALIGKWAGLLAAHAALAAWTARRRGALSDAGAVARVPAGSARRARSRRGHRALQRTRCGRYLAAGAGSLVALGCHEAPGMVGGELSIFVHDHAALLGAESCARRLARHRAS